MTKKVLDSLKTEMEDEVRRCELVGEMLLAHLEENPDDERVRYIIELADRALDDEELRDTLLSEKK